MTVVKTETWVGAWGQWPGQVRPPLGAGQLRGGAHQVHLEILSVVHADGSVHELAGMVHEGFGPQPASVPHQSQPLGYCEGHELPLWSLVLPSVPEPLHCHDDVGNVEGQCEQTVIEAGMFSQSEGLGDHHVAT